MPQPQKHESDASINIPGDLSTEMAKIMKGHMITMLQRYLDYLKNNGEDPILPKCTKKKSKIIKQHQTKFQSKPQSDDQLSSGLIGFCDSLQENSDYLDISGLGSDFDQSEQSDDIVNHQVKIKQDYGKSHHEGQNQVKLEQIKYWMNSSDESSSGIKTLPYEYKHEVICIKNQTVLADIKNNDDEQITKNEKILQVQESDASGYFGCEQKQGSLEVNIGSMEADNLIKMHDPFYEIDVDQQKSQKSQICKLFSFADAQGKQEADSNAEKPIVLSNNEQII